MSFFARKVTASVAAIVKGTSDRLELGSLTRVQDWGRATDFVAQLPKLVALAPSDYVMSTGDPRSAQEWVTTAFECVNLDWREYVQIDETLGNVTDVPSLTAPPDPRLNWEPDRNFPDLIRWMIEADL
jgi:GDPmannose 4,6-dehydratase